MYIRAHLIGRFDLKVLFEKLGDPFLIHPILAYALHISILHNSACATIKPPIPFLSFLMGKLHFTSLNFDPFSIFSPNFRFE